jgi:hypothetical protein
MTAAHIGLLDYVAQLRCSVPDVHPAGRATIDQWLDDMIVAADHGDEASRSHSCSCSTLSLTCWASSAMVLAPRIAAGECCRWQFLSVYAATVVSARISAPAGITPVSA